MKKHINKIVSLSLLALISGSCVSAREIVVVDNYKPLSVKSAMLQTSCPDKLPMANGFSPGCNKVQANSQANNPKSGANALAWGGLLATIFGATTFAYANKMGPFKCEKAVDDFVSLHLKGNDSSVSSNDNSGILDTSYDSSGGYICGKLSPWEEKGISYEEWVYDIDKYAPNLDDKVIDYLNHLDELTFDNHSWCLGREQKDANGNIVLMKSSYGLKGKCFLVKDGYPSSHGTLLNSEQCSYAEDGSREKMVEVLEEYKKKNIKNDAGLKYDILMRLIGLPLNSENDVKFLAKILRDKGVVNEEECISIGVTDFDNENNRIFAAMYGNAKEKVNYKKFIVSDGKGLNLHFDKTLFDSGDTASEGEWRGSSKRYYFITPTSIEDLKDNSLI